MINRVLIRLKVVQIAYAYFESGESGKKGLKWAGQELAQSLSSAYSLYNNLLYMMSCVIDYSRLVVEKKQQYYPEKLRQAELRFSQNRVLAQLSENKSLKEFMETEHPEWMSDSGLIKSIYAQILESRVLEDYMAEERFDYEADRDLCRRLYKSIVFDNAELEAALEEQNLYWNGDKDMVDSFVIKTFKGFKEENGADQPLLPAYTDPEDEKFASDLLLATIEGAEEYRQLIASHTRGWEAGRLAFMDSLIMQVGLAEIMKFPAIPLKVSINEYVEISKFYSTPNSAGFVNGMLDTIAKELASNGIINK